MADAIEGVETSLLSLDAHNVVNKYAGNWELSPLFKVGAAGNAGAERNVPLSRLVLDVGADSVKLGWAEAGLLNPSRIVPNLVTKTRDRRVVGEEVHDLKDYARLVLKRPHDRGYLLDWQLQSQILDLAGTYERLGAKFNPRGIDLCLTEAPFNPETLKRNTYEEIFEKNHFNSLVTPLASAMALHDFATNYPAVRVGANPSLGAIVVDSGYSFTHIVPFFDRTRLNYAIKRIDVGGKVLTNVLKEAISYRQWNMMEETWLVNHIKERLALVPADYATTMKDRSIRRHYVLPDGVSSAIGYVKEMDPIPPLPPHISVRPEEQILTMAQERLVPELLFSPGDIGLRQAGIPEAIVQAVNETPEDLHALLYSCIVLVGGNARIPGFRERLESELRTLVPAEYPVNVFLPADAWRGASKWMQSPMGAKCTVTRKEYEEQGYLFAIRRSSSY